MKYLTFPIIGLLLAISCASHPKSGKANGDSGSTRADAMLKSQEVIAKEILSIDYAFVDAMIHTNVLVFVTKAEPLARRLEEISKELDALGTFPTGLRESTIKELDDADKKLAQLFKSKIESSSPQPGSLQPEDAKITDPITDKYFLAWSSVMRKAGLIIKPKKE